MSEVYPRTGSLELRRYDALRHRASLLGRGCSAALLGQGALRALLSLSEGLLHNLEQVSGLEGLEGSDESVHISRDEVGLGIDRGCGRKVGRHLGIAWKLLGIAWNCLECLVIICVGLSELGTHLLLLGHLTFNFFLNLTILDLFHPYAPLPVLYSVKFYLYLTLTQGRGGRGLERLFLAKVGVQGGRGEAPSRLVELLKFEENLMYLRKGACAPIPPPPPSFTREKSSNSNKN